MEQGRKFNTALGCVWKHYQLAIGKNNEVILKIARECSSDEFCDINPETRQEMQEAVRELLLAEGHYNELINKTESKELRNKFFKLLDETREIRQRLVLTNLAYRANIPVSSQVKQTIPQLNQRIDGLLQTVEQYATDIDINANLPKCEKCDAEFGELMDSIEGRRALVTQDEIYDSEISSPRRGKRSLLDGLPRPLAKVQERLGPSEGKGKGGVTASGFPLKDRKRIWQPGQFTDKLGQREKSMEKTDDEKLKPESKEGWYPGKYLRGRVRDREYEPESDDEERPRQRLLGGFRKRLRARED